MEVKNETAVYYKYIDMTAIVERLFGFIQDTIEHELVSEMDFILDYDKAKLAIYAVYVSRTVGCGSVSINCQRCMRF